MCIHRHLKPVTKLQVRAEKHFSHHRGPYSFVNMMAAKRHPVSIAQFTTESQSPQGAKISVIKDKRTAELDTLEQLLDTLLYISNTMHFQLGGEVVQLIISRLYKWE